MKPELLIKAGIKGGSAFKHKWTDEEREIVRRDWKGTIESAEKIARYLTYLAGEKITKYAVRGQIAIMGIATNGHTKYWTPQEIERLAKLITRHPIYEIANMMNRSKNSIRVKATRLGYTTRCRDGWFTKKEVCEILGVGHKKVQKWIDAGAIKADYHTDRKPQKNGMAMWHISSGELASFIRHHACELQGRNVDMFTLVELLSLDTQETQG